jgi:hypothetical protein
MNRVLFAAVLGPLVLLTITACAVVSQTSEPTFPAVFTSEIARDSNGMNFLVDVEGVVELKRQGWTDYIPVTFGTRLEWGDIVRVSDTASAVLACADLSIQPLMAGYFGGLPCPRTVPVLIRQEAPILNPRSSALPVYPLVLSPRATALIDPHPLLRWSPVTGIVTYTVVVRGRGLNWQTRTQQTEIEYPADAPPLQPGGDGYVLVIDANDHSSEEEGSVFRGFILLEDDTVRRIRDHEQRIARLSASDTAHRYLTAQMYATHDLHADAIITLETLASDVNAPVVWNALADQYSIVGLYDQASNAYTAAQALAELKGDTLAYAQAELGLGHAYWGLNDAETALSHTQRALELFQSLNDGAGMAQSEGFLKQLRAP